MPTPVSFVGSTKVEEDGAPGTGIEIDKPAGVADGDLMIMMVVNHLGGASNTPSGGWTEIATVSGRWRLWYRLAGASEPSSYTIENSGHALLMGSISAWRNVDDTNPINVFEVVSSDSPSTVEATPSVTTTDSPTRLLHMRITVRHSLVKASLSTTTSGHTEVVHKAASTSSTWNRSLSGAIWEADSLETDAGLKNGINTVSSHSLSEDHRITLAVLGPADLGSVSNISVAIEMGDAEPTFKACGANLSPSPTIELSVEAVGSLAFLEMRPMLLAEVGSIGIGEPLLSPPSHLVSADEGDIDDEGEEDGFLVGVRLGITEKYEVAGMGI